MIFGSGRGDRRWNPRRGLGLRDWRGRSRFGDRRGFQEIFAQRGFDVGNELAENRGALRCGDCGLGASGRGVRGSGWFRRNGFRCDWRGRLGDGARQESIAQRCFEIGNEFFEDARCGLGLDLCLGLGLGDDGFGLERGGGSFGGHRDFFDWNFFDHASFGLDGRSFFHCDGSFFD